MKLNIARLTESDLQRIDDLSRNYRSTLGFLTMETYRDYLSKGGVLGARTATGELVGYVLFADYYDRFRIAQLCVSEAFRGKGIARQLIDKLKETATTQKVIKLRCRRDFPAHDMWPKLGFIPLDEKPGRSAQGLPLTLWCNRIAQDDELGLWRAETSDEVLDIVIDAQIFYDFDAEETSSTTISKGLLEDYLLDSLNIWVSDELFIEINRQKSDEVRQRSLERARGMARLSHRQDQVDQFIQILQSVLPYRDPSEKSDIHHLAKTAASDVRTFVTKDEKLIRKSTAIKSLTGVSVIHPSKLIISLHEISEKHSYSPSRVSGINLHWRRIRDEDCASLSNGYFQHAGESKGKLTETIRSYLSHPNRYQCEFLWSQKEVVAIRVLDTQQQKSLNVVLSRISRNAEVDLFAEYLVADTLSLSIEKFSKVVIFSTHGSPEYLFPTLVNMGFKTHQDGWIKLVIAQSCCRNQAQACIATSTPDLSSEYQRLNDLDFDRDCAPLASNETIPTYVVPIKPAFAMGLINKKQAADDLFGGKPSVLLRWNNVYFRGKSRHRMIRSPGRILWYVSGNIGSIVAVSHLDEVEVGLPKNLFKKYQKFGILEWRDLYSMCGKRVDKEIMVLRFSHTFLFKKQISLKTMKKIFSEDDLPLLLISPIAVSFNTLGKLYKIGFSNLS